MHLESYASQEKVLIERIKQGERISFDNLVSLYQQKGLSIAYNLVGNLEDAKDILQESFIKVYLNVQGFKEKSEFFTWFYRIVVNCALDFLRKRKRMNHIFIDSLIIDEEGKKKEQEIADNRFEPAKVAMLNELHCHLDNCLARLSEKQRLCFVLKHQNGLSTQEVARVLKCRPATVKVHIFRAINNLRKSLAKYII